MRVNKENIITEENQGWRVFVWKGNKSKSESTCIIEIDPNISLIHQHITTNFYECEIILEGTAKYEGAINGIFKFGDVVIQKGKSKIITIKNISNKKLRILCINRPAWSKKNERIYS